jgi:hypothetical protein
MKNVYLIGFRGLGLRLDRFKSEHLLIRVGHVGFSFEGNEGSVFGFHPTQRAADAVGDETAVIAWLKAFKPLEGTLHDDTAIFHRAWELGRSGARIQVWQRPIPLQVDTFEKMRETVLSWYQEHRTFTYAFPGEMPIADRDNCATFPRRFGLELPESTGQLIEYIPVLAAHGTLWSPKEE